VFVSGATTVQRNDIIVTRSWVGDAFYVKRVIGMPGDNIEYRDGVLWLNGVETPELWEGTDSYQVTVPDGKLWVLGDNRQNSSDSRENGLLERDNVVGVAYMRVLPFDRFTAPID
jgi:signal peptidase I